MPRSTATRTATEVRTMSELTGVCVGCGIALGARAQERGFRTCYSCFQKRQETNA